MSFRLSLAVVFAVAGEAFWLVGQADRRVADVHHQLATLQYAAAAENGAAVEESLDLERRVPIVGPQAAVDVHGAATTARYWESDYAGVQPQHDANGTITDTDPAVLRLAANAAFRASQASADRAETVRKLDGAIKSYTDALKANGQDVDTAFNYEYTRPPARLDGAAARRGAQGRRSEAGGGRSPVICPTGPTLHGHPGAPPTKTEMSQFKIVIPKRGDERKDNPEAGKGGQKIRKG